MVDAARAYWAGGRLFLTSLAAARDPGAPSAAAIGLRATRGRGATHRDALGPHPRRPGAGAHGCPSAKLADYRPAIRWSCFGHGPCEQAVKDDDNVPQTPISCAGALGIMHV